MKKHLFFVLAVLLSGIQGFCQPDAGVPPSVRAVLSKSGQNKAELQKAIIYFKKDGDPLKLRALYFLISNMDCHFGADYYWADGRGNKVAYNELSYPGYDAYVSALNTLKVKVPALHAVSIKVADETNIKATLLISTINSAFKAWKSQRVKNIPFTDFCEYILPYRVSVEPVQDWRTQYQLKYNWFLDTLKKTGIEVALYELAKNNKTWFHSTYGIEQRLEPLPRLGALQLLSRKKGPCEDMADLNAFALRSLGIPVALDIVPYWATSTGSHFVNTVFGHEMLPIHYDASRPNPLLNKALNSEPSKVIRITFSRQKGTLASLQSVNTIPDGFMRTENYLDVTKQYWETTNFSCNLFPGEPNAMAVYACVFNGLAWRPTWWSRKTGNSALFKDMTKGVVYLPAYYIKNKIVPAGYPVAEGYHHEKALVPDFAKKTTIHIQEKDKYLTFQPYKKYKLFYWDNQWKPLGVQTATYATHEMYFNDVPGNCLYLLLPEYSQKKERPFIITETGTLNWF